MYQGVRACLWQTTSPNSNGTATDHFKHWYINDELSIFIKLEISKNPYINRNLSHLLSEVWRIEPGHALLSPLLLKHIIDFLFCVSSQGTSIMLYIKIIQMYHGNIKEVTFTYPNIVNNNVGKKSIWITNKVFIYFTLLALEFHPNIVNKLYCIFKKYV